MKHEGNGSFVSPIGLLTASASSSFQDFTFTSASSTGNVTIEGTLQANANQFTFLNASGTTLGLSNVSSSNVSSTKITASNLQIKADSPQTKTLTVSTPGNSVALQLDTTTSTDYLFGVVSSSSVATNQIVYFSVATSGGAMVGTSSLGIYGSGIAPCLSVGLNGTSTMFALTFNTSTFTFLATSTANPAGCLR